MCNSDLSWERAGLVAGERIAWERRVEAGRGRRRRRTREDEGGGRRRKGGG